MSEAEQRLFARLAVFGGGCALEAIAAVCTPDADVPAERDGDVLTGIDSLVANSLLRQEEGIGEEARFVMLETIHEYARERLAATREETDLRRRHAAYFLGLAEAAQALAWHIWPVMGATRSGQGRCWRRVCPCSAA